MAGADSVFRNESVSAKLKKFIVLCVGDKDSWGYNEDTLPLLLKIMDSSKPSARVFTYIGVIGFHLSSRHAFARVEQVVAQIEQLRASDKRFNTLGIGLAYGDLLADFDWFGRLKRGFMPLGETANHASAGVKEENKYKETLGALRAMFR